LFDCEEFHSEFQVQEVRRHEQLTDKMSMHFFELGKLPKELDPDDELQLWLSLFNAKTEEDFARIEATEVPIMKDAIGAYRQVTATDQFRELERIRARSRHNEASALYNAECRGESRGEQRADKKWQGVVAEKDAKWQGVVAENERLRKLLAELQAK
jgi:hypothetical protein